MSYKRKQFIEKLDEIIKEVDDIFILDRGGCIIELQDDSNYYSAPARAYLFRKEPEEWRFWFDTFDPSRSISEIKDEIDELGYDTAYEDSAPIKATIVQLLANRKDLRDIIIEADGQIVID